MHDSLKSLERRSVAGRFATELRSFGPAGIFAIVIILVSGNIQVSNIVIPFGALFVLLWIQLSRTPWREIGYVKPGSWLRTIITGLVFGCAFKLLMKALVMPVLGADPINKVYHYLAGNTAMLPAAIWAMLVAGFGEETVFRGFLFERLGRVLGQSRWAKLFIIILTSLLFGLSHYSVQGFTGTVHATIFGLVFGSIFAITGRIFMLMIAHAVFDLTALALIYWELELDVAHFFFR